MILVGTEDNGLVHPVCLAKVLRYLVRYLANAVLYDNVVIIVRIVIFSVFDKLTVNIALPLQGSPAVAYVGGDIDNLIGCQEAIVDTLLEAIAVERFAKIGDVRLVAGFLGSSRHTNLYGIAEILQNLAPVAIVLGTTSMALIHYHHIKEFGFEELLVVLGALLPYQLLVEGEVNLVGCVGVLLVLLITDLMDGVCKGFEVLLYRLVHQYVAVGQIEYLLYQASLKQTIDNLEGRIGLARSRGHHQEDTFLASGYGIDGTVYGIALIVTGRKDVLPCAIGLIYHLQLLGG